MRRWENYLTFALFPITIPCTRGLLVMETRAVISAELVGRETSYGMTDDLLGMAIRTANSKKFVDEEISPREIDG